MHYILNALEIPMTVTDENSEGLHEPINVAQGRVEEYLPDVYQLFLKKDWVAMIELTEKHEWWIEVYHYNPRVPKTIVDCLQAKRYVEALYLMDIENMNFSILWHNKWVKR